MARFDLRDFKKQASFFLREKLNDARLVLTDVSRIQLLTEEATNEDAWGPETRTMATLADAAFELEEYDRIVGVIHQRLDGGQKRPWRQLYKTLVVLEYLLTHGPKSLGKEFKTDICWVDELSQFNFTDQQGIDRGLMVRKKADRVLELLTDPDFRNEERSRARKVSVGIQGFGSNPHQMHPQDAVQCKNQQCHVNEHEGLASPVKEVAEQSRYDEQAEVLQTESKGVSYEKCPSMSFQMKQVNCSSSAREKKFMATSLSSGEKSQTRAYKKSLSSPGYFREKLPLLKWQPAHDGITESEEASICLLDEVKERVCPLREDVEGAFSDDDVFIHGNESRNMASCNDALSLFEGINPFALADICKSSMEEQSLNISGFPMLPQPAFPKLRMKFQHQWQPASLIDCDVKCRKAV